MSGKANHAQHRTAAKRRSFDGAGSSDAAFAGSARSRRQSVIWSFGSAPPIRESSGYESPAAAHLAGSDRIPD